MAAIGVVAFPNTLPVPVGGPAGSRRDVVARQFGFPMDGQASATHRQRTMGLGEQPPVEYMPPHFTPTKLEYLAGSALGGAASSTTPARVARQKHGTT